MVGQTLALAIQVHVNFSYDNLLDSCFKIMSIRSENVAIVLQMRWNIIKVVLHHF